MIQLISYFPLFENYCKGLITNKTFHGAFSFIIALFYLTAFVFLFNFYLAIFLFLRFILSNKKNPN